MWFHFCFWDGSDQAIVHGLIGRAIEPRDGLAFISRHTVVRQHLEEKTMKRHVIYATASLLTFGFGISLFQFTAKKRRAEVSSAPLIVMVSRSIASPKYQTITIKNVSDRVVRGYSLGHKCNCRSWDSDDRPYPEGISFTNPIPEQQFLQPGESQEFEWQLTDSESSRNQELEVWVDLVHFQDGVNWGPNQSHKEGYVRQ